MSNEEKPTTSKANQTMKLGCMVSLLSFFFIALFGGMAGAIAAGGPETASIVGILGLLTDLVRAGGIIGLAIFIIGVVRKLMGN